MDKKKQKKRKKRVISVAVIATAFLLCIMATFGVTMAYFGGKSNQDSATMTLKTALWVNSKGLSSFSGKYVSPSQALTQACEVSVKSSNQSTGTAVTGDAASDALLRATITWDLGGIAATGSSSASSFDVTVGSTAAAAKLMKWTSGTGADNNWYLVDKSTTTMSGDATMYTIKCSSGAQTLKYNLTVTVPNSIKNSDVSSSATSKTIKVTIQYSVVQADFYNSTTSAVAKTVTNAKAIFDATTDSAAY